jgi:hypothetical protein
VHALRLLAGRAVPVWLPTGATAMAAVLVALAVLTLLAGYARAAPASRRRMRWVLTSTGLLMGSLAATLLVRPSPTEQPVLFAIFNTGLPGLAVLGYLYAILRTRVVEVTFVIDRALVFSVTTALLFGMFSLLEQTVHRFALGEEVGWLVQALGAVVVAAALRALHRLLDRGLERVFFHRLRTMVSALRRCAVESAFFESQDALLSRVLKQLLVPCAAVSIYERNGAVYRRRVAQAEGWPEAMDRDDRLFVVLRVERSVLDLKGLESAAGADGLAFPMTVGQLLTGAVICKLREGEQLDGDVRAAIAELARALGTSLYLLRYREQERLLAAIAAGSVEDAAVRSRVAAVLGTP